MTSAICGEERKMEATMRNRIKPVAMVTGVMLAASLGSALLWGGSVRRQLQQ
jgi:hypothetical protein